MKFGIKVFGKRAIWLDIDNLTPHKQFFIKFGIYFLKLVYLLVCSQGNIYNKRAMGFRSMKLAGIERGFSSTVAVEQYCTVQYENWGVVPPSTGPNFPMSRLGSNLWQTIFIGKNRNNLNPDFKGKYHISCKISTVLFYVLIWWSQPI